MASTVRLSASAGASGCSIEDWNPREATIEDIDRATEQVAIAVAAADEEGLILTARAENHLRGHDDLDDTIARLTAYRDADAHVLSAPALTDLSSIARIVAEVVGPVNVLLLPGGPSLNELAAIGVRRLSVGNALARVAYGAMHQAAQDLRDSGALAADETYLERATAGNAFKPIDRRGAHTCTGSSCLGSVVPRYVPVPVFSDTTNPNAVVPRPSCQTRLATIRSAAENVSRTGQILNQITGVRAPVRPVSTAKATRRTATTR